MRWRDKELHELDKVQFDRALSDVVDFVLRDVQVGAEQRPTGT